ncbi:MAG: glycosyl hydrolase family 38, partial [Gemmatimonadales bacterium]|nr:glycosyl hydrolase family 38 [Gemmatimonadales bacterium]NIN50040.1 glycosyl hydrolase family 38 [Gemmatimonadales bacterium]NIP07504.1 glycosyl hydrolase family 38 [Gemmatimonadales bacterium]NIR03143.1 glycosyl hydrolase family 38 [Gemmatimonadales bacterium]NIS66855.1 glycosyl hydrolase family 38 [Gemmatimonadales bacterium]
MDVYLLHHTHLDIGYTHHQDDVERLQWEHLENAIRYGEASEQLPDGARFVWNPEGLWAVESYLATHGAEQRERLLEAIRRGWIHLDAMFGNLLTGITSSEGLMRSLEAARSLSAQTGVPIRSAMLSDIPGFTWGLVPVLAQHGVEYLSIGPNFGHRIGYFLDTWGDRPFYWESPSGRERVLTWVSAAGYAWFHSGLGYERITTLLTPENVFRYLDRLSENGYPYDITYMRYNIGSDNGPPDPNIAETVRAWNERYVSPRLIISGTTGLFEAFEERYGGELPVYRGDLTGHWEDGAASSARETALVRRTAESLVQTEVLAAMLGNKLPEEDLSRAWRNVALFYEHTWGSWNSISEPEAEFTLRQWATKKAFADSAARLAERLRRRAESRRFDPSSRGQAIAVYNTLSWPRTDVVTVPAALSVAGDRVVDAMGRVVPSQRLNTGELALLAEAVPAFGSKRYVIEGGEVPLRGDAMAGRNVIGNHRVRVEVDTLRGTVRSLRYAPADRELAGDAALNQYLYVSSRDPADWTTNGPVTVRVVEAGPLVAAIEVQADASGTHRGIRSEIRLYSGLDRVDIVNRVDKALVYDPEAVLYRFDFDFRSPEVRVDVPWGSYRPEADQLPGSCKNYLSVQRWVDVHDREVGVTVTTIDAPMIQLGAIRTDPIVAGWDRHLAPSGTLYSYAMNNYWETNYRAGQEGAHELRYSITPHLAFDEAAAER